jgi:STE24 endopeptidase
MTALLLIMVATAAEPKTVIDSGSAAISLPVAVPQASAKAMRFYRSGLRLWWLNQAAILVVPALILITGLSARLRTLTQRKGRSWFLSASLFGVLYVLINGLITLPLDYYEGFVRPKQYGLSADGYGLGSWLLDQIKGLGLTTVLTFCLLWLPYLAMRKMPKKWPWVVALGSLPLAFGLMLLDPIVIDPMFNQFGPMRDKALEAKILTLADRAGIEGGRVFEVDKAKQTNAVNAYVKGVGGTHRIVLWDTLTNKLDERQVLFVMGHEMGHYALGHVTRSLLLVTICTLVLCLFLKSAGSFVLARFGSRWGIDRLDDVASLPLALVLGNAFLLFFSPVGLAYSRHQEHEADRFALELTRDNQAGAEAFVAMQGENLSNPRPGGLSVFWRSTHPPLAQRIEFCNAYRPWDVGEPGRYEGLFRSPK